MTSYSEKGKTESFPKAQVRFVSSHQRTVTSYIEKEKTESLPKTQASFPVLTEICDRVHRKRKRLNRSQRKRCSRTWLRPGRCSCNTSDFALEYHTHSDYRRREELVRYYYISMRHKAYSGRSCFCSHVLLLLDRTKGMLYFLV